MSVGIVALALTGPVEVSTFDPADMPTLPTDPPHPYGVTAIQNEALGQVLYRQFSERFRAYTFVVKDELLVKDGFGHYDHATAGEARTLGVEAAAYAGVTAGAVPEGYLTDVFDPADVPLGPPPVTQHPFGVTWIHNDALDLYAYRVFTSDQGYVPVAAGDILVKNPMGQVFHFTPAEAEEFAAHAALYAAAPPEVEQPPPPVTATGATAGSPGSFTPAGAVVPADLAGLGGVTADPTTAWTTGQHVVLGDASSATWNGTAWAAGVAADPEAMSASRSKRPRSGD